MRMCSGLRNRMKARTSLYSVIRPLIALTTEGTMSTVALKDPIDSYSAAILLSRSALAAVRRVWVGALLPRVITRRRARHDVSSRNEHASVRAAAARRNSIYFIVGRRKTGVSIGKGAWRHSHDRIEPPAR